jgi:hypothetical protein
MQGQVYISNKHLLVITIGANGTVFLMGDRVQVTPDFPPTSLDIQVHYDFGTDVSLLTVFRGEVGDNTETVLCSSALLSGSGVFRCSETLTPDVGSYYRAYSEDQTVTKAYTNPIFFRP